MSGIQQNNRKDEKKNIKKVLSGKNAKLRGKIEKIPVLRLLTHNTGLKVLSLAFAIVLWAVVMTQTNPTRTKVVYDVPVELTGLSTLNERELSLATEEDALPATVDVYLDVPMDDLSKVNKDNVTATIDFSRITSIGAHELRVNLSTTYGTARSSTVGSVDVEVESLTHSIVPVQVSTTGTLSGDYRLGKVVATPAQFQITGQETEVNRVVAAVAQVDLTDLNSDFNRSVVYTLVDENSEPVESANISSTVGNSVSVSIPVYPIRELPITFESSTTGLLKDGFYLENIEIAPTTVRVAAPQSVLDELTGIPVSTIDLEGADETFTVTLPLKKNPDIVWMDVSDVDVVVRVKEEEATKTFKGLPVTYRNLGAGLTAELYNATVDIEVTMAKSALEKLTNDDISVYVDLTGYEAMGDSVAPLSVSINTDASSNAYTLSTEKVVLKITKTA